MGGTNQNPEENQGKNPERLGQGSNQSQEMQTYQCKECGENFERYDVKVSGFDFSKRYCDKCVAEYERKEKEEEENYRREAIEECKESWRENSGLTGALKFKSFNNFVGKKNTVIKTIMEWAESFDIKKPYGAESLMLYSAEPGMGKTHLMAATVNRIINKWEGDPEGITRRPIRFESGPGLVRRIRSTYFRAPGSQHETEEDVYNELKGVRLLLLDDVGKERPSDFTRETYWYIIDERLKYNLPVIISTRVMIDPLEELMGEDTVDRIFGMTRGNVLVLEGKSYRRRNLQP